MAAEKPPKPRVRQQYVDNISELQDEDDVMIIGRDSFDLGDIATGIRNLANQTPRTRNPDEVYARVIGFELDPAKAAEMYETNFKSEADDDVRYIYKIRADLHEAHLEDPSLYAEDDPNYEVYLSLHPDAITSPDYDGPPQIPLGADVVCKYRNVARREGLYITRVEDYDANAGAVGSSFSSAVTSTVSSLSGLFKSGTKSVLDKIGFNKPIISDFETPLDLNMTAEEQTILAAAVRKLIMPNAKKYGSSFGLRTHPVTKKNRSFHRGCDFSMLGASGNDVISPKPGVIKRSFSTWSKKYKGPVYLKKGGNQVVVDHQDGTKSYFLHLQSVEVSLGQTVSAGQKLGTMGNTGAGTGPHLHYAVKEGGSFVDPVPLLLQWLEEGVET